MSHGPEQKEPCSEADLQALSDGRGKTGEIVGISEGL